MNEEIDVFLKQLLNAEGKAVNMSPACERLATDIAGQLAFGQPLHTQVYAKNRIFPRAMMSMNAVVNLFSKPSRVYLLILLETMMLTASHWPGHPFHFLGLYLVASTERMAWHFLKRSRASLSHA